MAANSMVNKKTHKYGVEGPNVVEDSYRLDRVNGNKCRREEIEN